MYAIVRTGGKQYRVSTGDRIVVEHLEASEGDEITLDDVLVVGNESDTKVGAPTVAGASVTARVDAQSRARKVTNFQYKNKTRQHRRRGHRQHQTELVITGIDAG
jgi:large subunit ribosomal protein L21